MAKAPQDPRLLFEMGGVADAGGDADKVYEQDFYRSGRGELARSDAEAVLLFRLSADQGNAVAQARLGRFCETGRGGLVRSDAEAARLYKLAAGRGNAGGEACLGDLYRDGRGGPLRDDSGAARLYRLAAEQGDGAEQAGLGALYANGLGGLTRNDDEAARLYTLAADQGHAVGPNNLGTFYCDGRGGRTRSDGDAAGLFRLAADQGNPYGQLDLAYFYENGRGALARDGEEAARLYDLAAAQGVKDQNVTAAPTTAAKIAYNYLQEHYTSNGIINYNISSYDNNVCHLRYLFFAESDFNIKYDFDAADIRLDTVKSVPPRQGGALGIGFAGIDLEAAPGRHFKADGRIKRASLPPAASSIRLLATIQPDAAMVQALVKLATECGAKPPPSSVVQ